MNSEQYHSIQGSCIFLQKLFVPLLLLILVVVLVAAAVVVVVVVAEVLLSCRVENSTRSPIYFFCKNKNKFYDLKVSTVNLD